MSGQITGQKKKKKTTTPPPGPVADAPVAGGGGGGGWGPSTSTSKVQFTAESTVEDKAPVVGGGRPNKSSASLVSESHIKLMEPDRVAAATIDFADLLSDEDGSSVTAGGDSSPTQQDAGGKLCTVLQEFGFAVVTNVLNEEAVASLESLWAADLTSIVSTHLKPTSKEMAFMQDPTHKWPAQDEDFALGTKFATMYGLPQGQCAWATRCHPNVKKVYEVIYGTEKLCVGMDNVFFNPKTSKIHNDAERSSNLWPHADQNYNCQPEGRYDVFQGVLYLWPADIDSSATIVWPGSNNTEYSRLMQQTNAKGHFCMLPKPEHETFAMHARRVPVPRGGMLLWSSKTIHQGWPHGPRLAIPVCFEPTGRRNQEALKRKIMCIKAGKPTTHWASLGKPHSMSAMANGDVGGTGNIKLVHKSHLHALDQQGEVIPQIQSLL